MPIFTCNFYFCAKAWDQDLGLRVGIALLVCCMLGGGGKISSVPAKALCSNRPAPRNQNELKACSSTCPKKPTADSRRQELS